MYGTVWPVPMVYGLTVIQEVVANSATDIEQSAMLCAKGWLLNI